MLDDDKKNFFFYQVEGPAKPLLLQMKMPADQGVACLKEILATIRQHAPRVCFPLEYRYIKGDDTLIGGGGVDTIYGGDESTDTGIDTVSYAGSGGSVDAITNFV